MSKITPIISSVSSGIKTIAEKGTEGARVAERYSRMNNLSPTCEKTLKARKWTSNACKQLIDSCDGMSDSFDILTNTIKSVNKNVNKEMRQCANNNTTKSQARINGLKNSVPDIKNALKEVSGINDIQLATKEKGLAKGIQETGKAVARVTTCAGMAVVGTFIPVPGATLACWVAGEKLINACFGKPFSKQIKNLAK